MYVSILKYVQHPRMGASKASKRLGGTMKKTISLKMSGTPNKKSSTKTSIQQKSIIVKDNNAKSKEVVAKNLLNRVGLLIS